MKQQIVINVTPDGVNLDSEIDDPIWLFGILAAAHEVIRRKYFGDAALSEQAASAIVQPDREIKVVSR